MEKSARYRIERSEVRPIGEKFLYVRLLRSAEADPSEMFAVVTQITDEIGPDYTIIPKYPTETLEYFSGRKKALRKLQSLLA